MSFQDVLGQLGNEIIDFVIVGTVAAPDTGPGESVEAKTLRPRHEGLQQFLCETDVFPGDEIVDVRCHLAMSFRQG